MFQMNQLNSFVRPDELRHGFPPFPNDRNRRRYFIGYEGLMKIPRRCFAEAVWLYQNHGGKAMVFPMAVITNYYVSLPIAWDWLRPLEAVSPFA